MNYYIHNFRSDLPETPFAPTWNVFLIEKVWKEIDCESLYSFLIKESKEIFKLDPVIIDNEASDGNTKLGKKSIMSRYSLYNVFKYENEELNKLKSCVIEQHKVLLDSLKIPLPNHIYLNGWINLMGFGEKVGMHIHSVNSKSYLGGNFCVKVDGSETVYVNPVNQINHPETYHSQNEPGKLTLFENRTPHYSSRNLNLGKRMTIAFNLRVHDIDDNAIRIDLQ